MSKPTLQARAQFLGDVPNPKTPIAELWMMGARTLLDEALAEIERLNGAFSDVTKERGDALAEIESMKRDWDVAIAKDDEALAADRAVERALGREEVMSYAELATEALTELLRQVEAFVAENGEADFYTGQAKEVLAKNPFDPLRHETRKEAPVRVNCGKCDHPMGCESECRLKAASDEVDSCHQSCNKPCEHEWQAIGCAGGAAAMKCRKCGEWQGR